MALFGNKAEGGLMDVIRCDQQDYLVWKWRPSGEVNSTKKENAIRYGSSLRVKESEVAIFFYKQKDNSMYDFIIGPYDDTIKTANFPILTSIVGVAFGGSSPFQAEIYFVNLSGNIPLKFGIPYFDVFDNRFPDLGLPCAIRGTLLINITDYKNFIKLNRLINFDLESFKNQIKDFFIRKTKSVVMNIVQETGIPVMQLEKKIDEISEYIKSKISIPLTDDFGINLKRIDIGAVELNKEHPHYQQLKHATADQQTLNIEEIMRIQRKDIEMQVEGKNIDVFKITKQTEVLTTAAESLGNMGNIDADAGAGGGDGGGINPAGMMTGMMMGGAMGGQMANMMNQMGQNIQQQQTPPPPPIISFFIAVNGQQQGPYNIQQLQQLTQTGQFAKNTLVWKQGMQNWVEADQVPELINLFGSVPPPVPPFPPVPPQL